MQVQFEVQCTETKPGESVFVVGSAAELGAWDPKKGLNLKTDSTRFPVWYSEVALAPDISVLYKFVIQRESFDGRARWEDKVGDRKIDPAEPGTAITIQTAWNDAKEVQNFDSGTEQPAASKREQQEHQLPQEQGLSWNKAKEQEPSWDDANEVQHLDPNTAQLLEEQLRELSEEEELLRLLEEQDEILALLGEEQEEQQPNSGKCANDHALKDSPSTPEDDTLLSVPAKEEHEDHQEQDDILALLGEQQVKEEQEEQLLEQEVRHFEPCAEQSAAGNQERQDQQLLQEQLQQQQEHLQQLQQEKKLLSEHLSPSEPGTERSAASNQEQQEVQHFELGKEQSVGSNLEQQDQPLLQEQLQQQQEKQLQQKDLLPDPPSPRSLYCDFFCDYFYYHYNLPQRQKPQRGWQKRVQK